MTNVKDFWEEQAKRHKGKDTATAPDSCYRRIEIQRISEHIVGPFILDVGCGNGFSTFEFAERFPYAKFTAIDYSPEMIGEAKIALHRKRDKRKIEFITHDARQLIDLDKGKFDTIISERCLINLSGWEEQFDTILQMKGLLANRGRIILAENFTDGLKNLNKLRKQYDLPEIQQRWHNKYFDKGLFEHSVLKHFSIKHQSNIGNMYYIASRVLAAKMAANRGEEPSYDNEINKLAEHLPALGQYNYSPNMLYVLEPK